MHKYLLVVVGPTAVGKTAAAIRLAKYFNTEIISADARQCYQGMAIGTAQPTPAERKQIKHHLVDYLPVHAAHSAGNFEKTALALVHELFQQKDHVVVTGGSGLYMKALCEGLDDIPPTDVGIRNHLEERIKKEGLEALTQTLAALDPTHYQMVDLKNPRRVIRALEVCMATGKPYTASLRGAQTKLTERPFRMIKIGLSLPRPTLYERINERVDQMVKHGLIEEALALYPYRHHPALQAVGYPELFGYFAQEYSLEEAIERIQRNTRRYAKRQITWFSRQPGITWFQPTEIQAMLSHIQSELVL